MGRGAVLDTTQLQMMRSPNPVLQPSTLKNLILQIAFREVSSLGDAAAIADKLDLGRNNGLISDGRASSTL